MDDELVAVGCLVGTGLGIMLCLVALWAFDHVRIV